MSWLQRLSETYDACFGQPQFAAQPLPPIDHVEQQAHIEIIVDACGDFLSASVVAKESTLVPATEESAGRTSGPVAHPLCDKLRYVAADYGSDCHQHYLNQLRSWTGHLANTRLKAVLTYVERGEVVKDLVQAGVLTARADGTLESEWTEALSPLAKLLTADPKTRQRDQGNAFIRWRVELPDERETAVWKDAALQREWAAFNAMRLAQQGLCLHSGNIESLALSHPKRLRHGGDGAKLISANDSAGFTFRGRFTAAAEAYGLGSAATQKAHNALRWLIARQAARNDDQVIVAWSVHQASAAPVLADSYQFFDLPNVGSNGHQGTTNAEPDFAGSGYAGDAGQNFALRLKAAIQGYRERFSDTDNIVVMALDSATPGRMAILYYRELTGSEFLARLERWHRELAWPQDFGKERKFVGAPSPRDIAEAAFGRRIDGKLRKSTIERLLPCILDGRPVPRDLVQAAVARTSNRAGLERWEFERVLGIACSLYRGSHPKEFPTMSLDEARLTRDYLYGRLLALADDLEEKALWLSGTNRSTNAARLLQRFSDHPASTWLILRKQLNPYMVQLQSSAPGLLHKYKNLLDTVTARFNDLTNGAEQFNSDFRLSGEFLLGFHSQREALRGKRSVAPRSSASSTEEPQGETE